MGSLGTSLAAWLLFPCLAYLVWAGAGLLLDRVLRIEIPAALLAPAGMCVTVALVMPVYWAGAGEVVATPLAVAAGAIGLYSVRRDIRGRLNPGWLGIGALAAYLLFVAPVVFAGGWTWTGYNFVNDTSVQLLLADHLADTGMTDPPGPPELPPQSTGLEHIRIYFITGYPLGTHGLMAAMRPLGFAPAEAVYQPFIGLLGAMAALALGWLLTRISSAPMAAAGGFVAAVGALIYHYGLQGSVKEMAMLATLLTAVALARHALDTRRPLAAAVALGVAVGACVLVFSTAALPYLAFLALAAAVAVFVQRGGALAARDLLKAAPVAVVVATVVSLPALPKIAEFGRVAEGTFDADNPGEGGDLGHLLRPLKLIQTAGVWLGSDYRIDVPDNAIMNGVLIWLVIALAAAGLVHLIRRRETGLLLYVVAAVAALVVISPRVSPYADGKLLALATPAVVVTAWAGIAGLESIARGAIVRWAPLALAVAVAGGVLWSDALAYRGTQLAPIDRLKALEDIGERYEGEGLILVNDREQFAKYFMREARENVALENITPEPGRQFSQFTVGNVDVDQEPMEYLANFPLIVEREGADTSRPPANYRFEYASGPYTVWRRDDAVEVRAHQPFQLLHEGTQQPSCDQLVAFADQALRGEEVAVSIRPRGPQLETAAAERPPIWVPHAYIPRTVVTESPGRARGELEFEGGRYRIWVLGTLGRRVEVSVDGRVVGEAKGINTPGEWLSAGVAEVAAGRHVVEVSRPGGSLRPGDAFEGALGPVAFQPEQPVDSLEWMAPREVERKACARDLDWIEIARRAR